MWWQIISTFFVSTVVAQYFPKTYDMLQHCGSNISVNHDVRLFTNSIFTLNASQVCTVSLTPHSGDRLVVSFLSYSMSSTFYSDVDENCHEVSVQLTRDGINTFGKYGYCLDNFPDGQYGLGRIGAITVTNLQKYTSLNVPNIEVIVTEVYMKYLGHTCQNNQFDCHTYNTCIDKRLTCNGYNDCVNKLDETEGCNDRGDHIDINLIVAIIGGSLGLVFLISIIVVVCRCRRRNILYNQL